MLEITFVHQPSNHAQFTASSRIIFGFTEKVYINILTKRTIFITVNHLLPFLVVSSGSLVFDNGQNKRYRFIQMDFTNAFLLLRNLVLSYKFIVSI